MAFAQLTYRDGLRDIEACLRSFGGKLYHMGFRGLVARSTLADANDSHDWRIYALSWPERRVCGKILKHRHVLLTLPTGEPTHTYLFKRTPRIRPPYGLDVSTA